MPDYVPPGPHWIDRAAKACRRWCALNGVPALVIAAIAGAVGGVTFLVWRDIALSEHRECIRSHQETTYMQQSCGEGCFMLVPITSTVCDEHKMRNPMKAWGE